MQLATMPLDHVPVVSLDLETTGLRARSDRIVQIGAIRSHDATAALRRSCQAGHSDPCREHPHSRN